MTTNKNKRKRGKASRQSNRAAKRRKSKKENNTSAHSLPAKPATTVLMLLQPPKKWTSRHLEVTRLKLRDDVSSSTITGDGHIPRDVLFWTRVYRRLFFWHCDQVPGLLACGELRSHGAYVKYHGYKTTSILLIISLADTRSKTDQETLAQYEIPQALLQTILTYSHNQQLEQYTGYVITMDQTLVCVGKAVVSQSYLKSPCAKELVAEDLLYYHSAPFELVEWEDCREFLGVMFGVLRCLAESDVAGTTIDQA